MYAVAVLMTAGWPGWIDARGATRGAGGGGALRVAVASPTRLALIVLVAVVFLPTWFATYRR